MKNLQNKTPDISQYLQLLRPLSQSAKLELIAQLSRSMQEPKPKSYNRLYKSFGMWAGDETAEQLIETIRSARILNRSIEPF